MFDFCIRYRLSRTFVSALVSGLFLTAYAGPQSERTESEVSEPGRSAAVEGRAVENDTGPTIRLSYSRETFKENPISSFMYFVPLIARSTVDRKTSAENEQEVAVISYERTDTQNSFNVTCAFQIRGDGYHINTFDPEGMITSHLDDLKNNEPVTDALDYIKFEGEGYGRIEIDGTINGTTQTVTEVDVRFNAGDAKSPVTIGIYDVKAEDGQYRYANRSKETVARVNTLAFKRGAKPPKMWVTVDSIGKGEEPTGFFAKIKGVIANLLIKPVKISDIGNEAMLDFGQAISQKEPEFTFPKAKNIQEAASAR